MIFAPEENKVEIIGNIHENKELIESTINKAEGKSPASN